MKKIFGIESAYEEALRCERGKNMPISPVLLREIIDRIDELENAVIGMESGLRACNVRSAGVLEAYKHL